ncbi:MAG: hypothetical protein NTX70_07675 [Verrucomicrobia bacterium]|nr:hypothetical protein [Verrucomicrobiota bacterium]
MRLFEGLIPALMMTVLSVSGAVTNRATQGGSARPVLPTQPAGAASGGIQDIRGPIEILNVTPWFQRVLLILGVLAVLGGIWWALRRRTRQQAEFRESAAARARARLSESWAWVEQPERFCTRLSEVVRVYLEERFGLKAPDQTTEEFLASLPQSSALDAALKPLMEDFLTQCDWVKFAQGDPGRTECERLHQMASRLIDETGVELPSRKQAAERKGEA